jgi:hypothetical protein
MWIIYHDFCWGFFNIRSVILISPFCFGNWSHKTSEGFATDVLFHYNWLALSYKELQLNVADICTVWVSLFLKPQWKRWNNRVTSVAMKRRCKHAFPTVKRPCFLRRPCKIIIKKSSVEESWYPCGGGVEYLHRDPASRRRRRKGKSQIWDSKIWSQVPRDLDPRMISLARASSTYKRQTRPLIREGAPQEQDRNSHTSNKDLVVSPRWVLFSKSDWPADRRS